MGTTQKYPMNRLFVCVAALTVLCGTVFSAAAQQPAMPRKGAAVSILGDSYSTFEGYMRPDSNALWYFKVPNPQQTDVRSVRQTWWHRFIERNGCRLCVNNSFSGATICHTGYRGEDFSDRSFLTRLPELGCPDVIFIFGGTNDSWAGVPIGEYRYDDWSREELYRFRPALACLLATARERYPNVAVYFILNCDLKAEIGESVHTICDHYGVPCITLEAIDKQSGHPSVRGMEQICTQIEEFLKR